MLRLGVSNTRRRLHHPLQRTCPEIQRRFSTKKPFGPLRILFCGSDDFSAASLQALHAEHRANSDIISSLQVVCKKPKLTGRGLKVLREVPIATLARNLSLPLHEIDTFRGWQPPITDHGPINLIVAVSFGLLVPPRLLDAAEYGGLNVHPSLLPDLRGAAPLVHTLLQQREHTGITLQTLHPTKMDHGTILAQTPYPGLRHRVQSLPQLVSFIAPKGAEMLVESIRKGIFVPPLRDVGWCESERGSGIRTAPKITTGDRRIQWQSWAADEILLRNRILGPLFSIIPANVDRKLPERRIIWTSGFDKSSVEIQPDRIPGRPVVIGDTGSAPKIAFTTCDGHLLEAQRAKLEGRKDDDIGNTVRRAKLFESLQEAGHGLR